MKNTSKKNMENTEKGKSKKFAVRTVKIKHQTLNI